MHKRLEERIRLENARRVADEIRQVNPTIAVVVAKTEAEAKQLLQDLRPFDVVVVADQPDLCLVRMGHKECDCCRPQSGGAAYGSR